MLKDWKMIAIIVGIAFLLSFISGFLGKVSLGVLILRALIGGIVFGFLALGISVLIRRFLPEIFELQQDSVVITDEVHSGESSLPEIAAASGGSQVDISIGENEEENVQRVSSSEEAGVLEEQSAEGTALVEEIEETGGSDSSSEQSHVPPGLDILPDMGVFSNSFVGDVKEGSGSAGKAGSPTLDIMGEEQDPELVVRAVRTMVKKDQEG